MKVHGTGLVVVVKVAVRICGVWLLLLLLLCSSCRFQQELPNIPIVAGQPWPGVGHNARAGGGSRNQFGKVSMRVEPAIKLVTHCWTHTVVPPSCWGSGKSGHMHLH